MPANIDSVEGYGQQPRLADVQPTDIIPLERSSAPASVLVQTLVEFLTANITAGAKIDFGASPAGLTPAVGDVFFDTDDGIVYQYELAGWTAKFDFVSSAELAIAISHFLTQTTGDARYPLKTATDPYPTYLTQAEAAALFSPIGGDAQGGLRYNFVATTGTATTGQIRFNNATLASVTALSIHESDRNSAAQSEILDVVAIGTRIQVALEDNEEIYASFRVSGAVVDNGGDRLIPVTFISSAGSFAAGEATVNFLQIQGTSSGGHTIEVNGIAQPQRAKLNIVSPSATPTDDAPNDRTTINLSGGGLSIIEVTQSSAIASNTIAKVSSATPVILDATGSTGRIGAEGTGTAGIWSIQGGSFFSPDGSSNTGIRNKSTHLYAGVELISIGTNKWKVRHPADLTGIELFAVPIGDPRVNAYFDAISALGITLSGSEINAFQSGIQALDAITAWADVLCWYPMVGGTLASCAIDAKSPSLSSQSINWSGASSASSAGVAVSGTSQVPATLLVPTATSQLSVGVSVAGVEAQENLFSSYDYNLVLKAGFSNQFSGRFFCTGGGDPTWPIGGNYAPTPFAGSVVLSTQPGQNARIALNGTSNGETSTSRPRTSLDSTEGITLGSGVIHKSFVAIKSLNGLTLAQDNDLATMLKNFQAKLSR